MGEQACQFEVFDLQDDGPHLEYTYPADVTQYCIGTARRWITWLSEPYYGRGLPLALRIASLRPPGSREVIIKERLGGMHATISEPITIPRRGLPLSSLASALDYDDGNGVLVLGTDTGELGFMFFGTEITSRTSGIRYAPPILEQEPGGAKIASRVSIPDSSQ